MTASVLRWSREDARAFLARYHFTRGDIASLVERLGSVQYDPLRPLGRNHDLVLQARVEGYRVDDWQQAAYSRRLLYDAWDKQACLVPPGDWPFRRIYRDYFRAGWHKRIFGPHGEEVRRTLAELERRGPLSSLDFENQTKIPDWHGSWYGPKLVKQILRALWDSGEVVTHHRVAGRHYYSLPAQVIPAEHLEARADDWECLRFLIMRRHQSAGLLRKSADVSLWSLPLKAGAWRPVVDDLVAEGELTPVDVEGERYHVRTTDLAWLEADEPEPRMTFVAPLDPIVWDRKALSRIFGFDYVWEVYKPEEQRIWGYYVLPVFYRDRFVARMEGRLDGDTFRLERWWWEDGVTVDDALLAAFQEAVESFTRYLKASRSSLGRRMPREVRRKLSNALAGEPA